MLGVCCQWLEYKKSYSSGLESKYFTNVCNERHLQFGAFNSGKYSDEKILSAWIDNLDGLRLVLENKVIPSGIRMFRISSNLFPLNDKVEHLLYSPEILERLKSIGDLCKKFSMRITTHPSQFVILNSNKQSVISNSIEILKHHAWIFDCMGFECDPNYAINIHGGAKGNRDILIASINSLPSNVRDRLTLENDERCFNVLELQDINLNTGIPIVLDTHHFSFNTGGISLDEAFKISCASWKNTNAKPLTHLSNTEPGMENAAFNKKRAHSLMVHYVPGRQRELNNSGEIDIEMEFKLKNIAALSAIDAFSLRRA